MSEPPDEPATDPGTETAAGTNDGATSARRRGLPVGPFGLVVVTLVALGAAALVARVGLDLIDDRPDAVDVQDALDETASAPLVPAGADAAKVGAAAPDVRLEYLDGGVQTLSDLRGTPVVLNFWASTCAPCLTEMPAFEEVRAATDGKVTVVGVAVADPPAAARRMVARTGVRYRNAEDPQAALFRVFGGTALPRTVIVDGAGIVRDVHSGALTAPELTDRLTQLQLLP